MGVIDILKFNLIRGSSLSFKRDKMLKSAFQKVKEEMEEHLQAINENTNEITSNYEYICELEAKMDKLTERLDKMQMFIETQLGAKPIVETKEIGPLSKSEQDVFTTLYILQEEKGNVTYPDIAEKSNLDEEEAASCVDSMISKGIPISKKYIDNEPYLKLDKDFKTLQAKANVLQLVH